jgi:hypothetical protein
VQSKAARLSGLAALQARQETRPVETALVWMAYAAAVLGSLKLVFENLRIGSTESLAASLLLFMARSSF